MSQEKYKNQYRIESSRLQGYDYSQNGLYFVTICTKGREHFWGRVENGEMMLNDFGKIADVFWQEIPKHFPFVKLDVHQVMPNHVHGNLEIINSGSVETRFIASDGASDGAPNITNNHTNKKPGGITGENNPMLNPGSLSYVIRWYKGRCSFEIKKMMQGNSCIPGGDAMNRVSTISRINFKWQSRFYDHIIRDETELNRIREYTPTPKSKIYFKSYQS